MNADLIAALISYLIFIPPIQIVVLFFATAIFFAVVPSGPKRVWKVGGFFLFNFWLLMFGLVGDLIWLLAVRNPNYVIDANHDPVFDWQPFLPTGDWAINTSSGITGTEVYLWWGLIAFAVWTFAIIAYRRTKRCLFYKPLRIGPASLE